MKQLVFGCILLVSCKHSAASHGTPGDSTSPALPDPGAAHGTPSNARECKIPSSWTKLDASFPSPPDELVVLDWRVRSDAPILVTEEALVWSRGHEEAGASWSLTTLYRNPKAENEWRLAAIDEDAPVPSQARFDHAPTSAEVDAFSNASAWPRHQRAPEDTAGRRCDAAWARVIGAAPPPPPK